MNNEEIIDLMNESARFRDAIRKIGNTLIGIDLKDLTTAEGKIATILHNGGFIKILKNGEICSKP